jgi:hypothetical protein
VAPQERSGRVLAFVQGCGEGEELEDIYLPEMTLDVRSMSQSHICFSGLLMEAEAALRYAPLGQLRVRRLLIKRLECRANSALKSTLSLDRGLVQQKSE